MPTFNIDEFKNAKASFSISPAGLNCRADLYLTNESMSTVPVSVSFVSTAAVQEHQFSVQMPPEVGEFMAYLDIYFENELVGAYYDPEPITIVAPVLELKLGVIDIISVGYQNRAPQRFIEVGYEPDSYGTIRPYGKLPSPTPTKEYNNGMWWKIRVRVNQGYYPEEPGEIKMWLTYEGVGLPYSYGTTGGLAGDGPFVKDIIMSQPFGDTSRQSGIYTGMITWDEYLGGDYAGRRTGGEFRISNMMQIL